jgi:CRISPR system Cascade subunit CasA
VAPEGRSSRGQAGFDLLDRPWLPLLGRDGSLREHSLLGAFRAAPDAIRIVGEIPTQSFALLRLFLAILHRATAADVDGRPRSGPVDLRHWSALRDDWGQVLRAVEDYLGRFRDRFDLFHPVTPFFQVHDLRTASGQVSGLEKLIADVPNGAPLFTTRVGPGLQRLTPAEAARWLVHMHAFDASGIRSGDPRDPRVKGGKGYPIGPGWAGEIGGLHLEGRTLADTLLLNLGVWSEPSMHVASPAEDLPPWEQPQHSAVPGGRQPVGPIGAYTWQARRVKLIGDATAVTGVVLCQGEKLTPHNRQTIEPMTVWRYSEPQSKKLGGTVYLPRRLDPRQALWRGLASVLPGQAPPTGGKGPDRWLAPGVVRWSELLLGYELLPGVTHIDLRAVGLVYGVQDSVVDDLVDDRLTLPVALLAPEMDALRAMAVGEIATTDDATVALRRLAVNLAAAGGAGKDERQAPAAAIQERAYDVLGRAFRQWLVSLDPQEAQIEAIRRWRHRARREVLALADELVAACPPAAWAGRPVDGRYLDVGTADRWFRTGLDKVLPPDRDEGPDDGRPPAQEETD